MTKDRPILKDVIKTTTKDVEVFQNKTIRPIIKMQHAFIIGIFNNYVAKRKVKWSEITKELQEKTIDSAITKDAKLKQFYIGSIVGHFSINELEEYLENKSEFDRRIKQIIIKRLKDSSTELK